MKGPDQHPDTEILDRLRTGLLDDDPLRKAAVEAHLQQCETCRHSYQWPATTLQQDGTQLEWLARRLDGARHRALQQPEKTSLHRLTPLLAAAAIALVAVLVIKPLQSPDTDETQLAGTTPGAVPDVYEDLDFYLWLADHNDSVDSST